MSRYRVTWADGLALTVRIRRRWFPWPSDSVVVGATVWTRRAQISAPHLRHEATHVRQYHERGWWWVLTHPRQREAEAHGAAADATITYEAVP